MPDIDGQHSHTHSHSQQLMKGIHIKLTFMVYGILHQAGQSLDPIFGMLELVLLMQDMFQTTQAGLIFDTQRKVVQSFTFYKLDPSNLVIGTSLLPLFFFKEVYLKSITLSLSVWFDSHPHPPKKKKIYTKMFDLEVNIKSF